MLRLLSKSAFSISFLRETKRRFCIGAEYNFPTPNGTIKIIMNNEHPYQSQNGSQSVQGDRFSQERAESEVRAMHTRLAELLDSVTVVAEGEIANTENTNLGNSGAAGSDTGESDTEVSAMGTSITGHPDFKNPNSDRAGIDRVYGAEIAAGPSSAERPDMVRERDESIRSFPQISSFEKDPFEKDQTESSLPSLRVDDSESTMPMQKDRGEEHAPSIVFPEKLPSDSEGAEKTMSSLEDEGADSTNSAISIKGRADGISIDVGAGSWRMLMSQLRNRLHQASGFFRGGTVTLNIGDRNLTVEEITLISEALAEHGMALKVIHSTSEETCQSATALGIATKLERSEGPIAQSTLTNHEELEHFVYRGNLRSGQILRRAETILVLGDVNPGAQIVSDGDVVVWGRLRGIAHAGSSGDTNAIISGLSMEPTQLRIAEAVAILPESQERRSLFGIRKRNPELAPRPEVAYLSDNQIVIEPWDESKPGGIMAFRRS